MSWCDTEGLDNMDDQMKKWEVDLALKDMTMLRSDLIGFIGWQYIERCDNA